MDDCYVVIVDHYVDFEEVVVFRWIDEHCDVGFVGLECF